MYASGLASGAIGFLSGVIVGAGTVAVGAAPAAPFTAWGSGIAMATGSDHLIDEYAWKATGLRNLSIGVTDTLFNYVDQGIDYANQSADWLESKWDSLDF